MKRRKLGTQGLEVSEIGLGCMGMSKTYGSVEEAQSLDVLTRALEIGIDFFDTAEAYGPYLNEELLGRAFVGKRDGIFLATKFGWRLSGQDSVGLNSEPKHIVRVVDASLRRLRTDRIDLLYQHRVDPAVPIEDVAGTVGELVRQGKVRFFGLSEASADTIRRAHATYPVSVLQSEYSLWERGIEERILPTLRDLRIGLVPFAPLGRGFLSGKARRAEEAGEDDYRKQDPRFQGRNFDANMRAVAAVRQLAEVKGATAAQISLAWLLHKSSDIVPIPGTTRIANLEENARAAKIALSQSEIRLLDASLSADNVAGPRYGEEQASYVDR